MKYIAILLLIIGSASVGKVAAQEDFRIMFYNVENMYDTKDNPLTNDDDLTPEGNLRWNNYKFWQKLNDISNVITSVGQDAPPALVGMCEVENDSVLYNLTSKTSLRKHKYEYIISQSKDLRGSNIALLYQRDQIKIITKNAYTPFLGGDSVKTTRDILHATGKLVNGDTLDIFICHFPSRRDGIKKTRPYRMACAELLKAKTDSISTIRKCANILIMGDFNDYPNDISLSQTLEAKMIVSDIEPTKLYNMFYHLIGDKTKGTYKYRGKWNYMDQFIVSGNLLSDKSRTHIQYAKAFVFDNDSVLEEDKKYGGEKPFRTYWGYKYLGGASDHLPIYLNLTIK